MPAQNLSAKLSDHGSSCRIRRSGTLVSDWTYIGAHKLRMEVDLAVIRLYGMVTLAEVQVFLGVFEQTKLAHGQLYILFDNTESPHIEPAARRQFITWVAIHPLAGVANYGGGVVQRTMVLLLMNAVRLLIKKAPPQTYVATEAEARAWLVEQRRVHAALAAA